MMNCYDDILRGSGSYAFIAIDFSNRSQHIYDDIIYPAVVDAGMLPVRSDEVLSESDQIHTQIEQLIRNARMFIADVTYMRSTTYANVFLELGVAVALGRPLVILSQDDEIPSDIKHLRIIRYNSSELGKRQARKELMSILQKSTNPAETILRKMLAFNDLSNYIVYGQATQEHIDHVFPAVNANYQKRLRTMSSEALGISQLTIAFQKIAWSTGKETIEMIPVNGYGAPDDLFSYGNMFIFGGPGANPLFDLAAELANNIYANALSIQFEQVAHQKKRYYVSKSHRKYPDDQYRLYDDQKDIGFVMRFPNPKCENAVITIAAGIRTYGTEAAIKLLVTPSLISKLHIYPELGERVGFWALIEAAYSDEDKQLEKITVIDSELLVQKSDPGALPGSP